MSERTQYIVAGRELMGVKTSKAYVGIASGVGLCVRRSQDALTTCMAHLTVTGSRKSPLLQKPTHVLWYRMDLHAKAGHHHRI